MLASPVGKKKSIVMNTSVKFGGKGRSSMIKDEQENAETLFPMDPKLALVNFSSYLMEFEKSEILDYEKIYFFNIKHRRGLKGPLKPPNGVDNNGFDNDKNEYICQTGDHFAYRYEVLGHLGKGSFG